MSAEPLRKQEIIPLLLTACPDFRPHGQSILNLWEGERARTFSERPQWAPRSHTGLQQKKSTEAAGFEPFLQAQTLKAGQLNEFWEEKEGGLVAGA